MTIEEALQMAEVWIEIEGVEGVAQGESHGEDCITVFVSGLITPSKIPVEFQGYKVVVETSEPFDAQAIE